MKKVDGRGQDAEREFELLVLDSAESDLPSEKPSRNASDHAWETHGWTTDRDARTLTNAYVMFWGHNAISWSSKKQRFVACFSTEAEHRVVALTSYELLCLKSLLLELGVLVPTPMSIYRDNFGTTYLCTNPVIILE